LALLVKEVGHDWVLFTSVDVVLDSHQ